MSTTIREGAGGVRIIHGEQQLVFDRYIHMELIDTYIHMKSD